MTWFRLRMGVGGFWESVDWTEIWQIGSSLTGWTEVSDEGDLIRENKCAKALEV